MTNKRQVANIIPKALWSKSNLGRGHSTAFPFAHFLCSNNEIARSSSRLTWQNPQKHMAQQGSKETKGAAESGVGFRLWVKHPGHLQQEDVGHHIEKGLVLQILR